MKPPVNRSVLIVDDDIQLAKLMDFTLKQSGYNTHCLFQGKKVLEYVERERPCLVLLDLRLPDSNGLDILKELKRGGGAVPEVIVISAFGDIPRAVSSIKFGAYDFISKPFEIEHLEAKVNEVFMTFSLGGETAQDFCDPVSDYAAKDGIVGKSQTIKKVFELIHAASQSDAHVLLSGESGTGKELVARAIHLNSPRKEAPFVAINCAAIPEALLESELYGYEKGAFTGAAARKEGKFVHAGAGTIFLDEISELPLLQQSKLLRVLQEKEIERIGGTEKISIRARFISATNQDLTKLIQENKFRHDLYYRLHVFPLKIPPLRERAEDIPELLACFVRQYAGPEVQLKIKRSVLQRLMEYEWPGNVRELENLVQRTVALKNGDKIFELRHEDLAFLKDFTQAPHDEKTLTLEEVERNVMLSTLNKTSWNISKAAKELSISRDTFYRKLKKYALVKPAVS